MTKIGKQNLDIENQSTDSDIQIQSIFNERIEIVNKGYSTKDTIDSMTTLETLREFENNPEGAFSKLFRKVKGFFFKTSHIENTPPIEPPQVNSLSWLEDELAILRARIESGDLDTETLIRLVGRLADLTLFNSSQFEHKETKTLQDALARMIKEQKDLYNNNKVFVTDLLTASISVLGGVAGWDSKPIQRLVAGISTGGQTTSKIFGNSVERDKTSAQHVIEQIKQQMELTRNNRGSFEQQSTKMVDQLNQAEQSRRSIFSDLAR